MLYPHRIFNLMGWQRAQGAAELADRIGLSAECEYGIRESHKKIIESITAHEYQMKTRLPTYQEMQELAAFLPRLYSEGFKTVNKWNGGDSGKDGSFTLPWPEYNPVVEEFYYFAANPCWLDYEYRPEEAARMLKDEEFVKSASLAQIKTLLTYCVRGERFSDGHWAEMIENGTIRKILERVNDLSTDALHRSDIE